MLCAALLGACASVPTHDEIQSSFDAGLKAYDAGDYKTAYSIWGDIEDYDLAALRNVALMLRMGKGVDKDPKTALKKMERAADLGLATAQADLGEMLINGEAGPPDKAAAVPWLVLAAAAGHPIAAFELAKIYQEGTAVPQDLARARLLYKAAADAGVPDAAKRLESLGPAPAGATPAAAASKH
jgi:TPR repeat protein